MEKVELSGRWRERNKSRRRQKMTTLPASDFWVDFLFSVFVSGHLWIDSFLIHAFLGRLKVFVCFVSGHGISLLRMMNSG